MEILSLGEKIKRRRKELNMTLKDLAQDRITPGQISLVESGRSNPSMDLLEYLAETLKTSVEYLMETEKTQAERICLYFEQLAEKAILDGNKEKVEKYIEYALHYAEKYDLEYRKAKNLYLRAEQNLRRDNLTEAQENYISANILFVKTASYLDVVKTYLNIGKISLKLKAYHSANSYLREAEKFYREYNLCEDYLLGEIYYFLSKSYYFIEDTQKAINFSYLAKKEFEKIYDRKKYAESLELLAQEYGKIGDMDNALRFSEKSLNIYKELQQLDNIATIEDSLGKLFYKFENLEESIEHYEIARKIRKENGDVKLLDTLVSICENYIKIKNIDKCIDILNEIKANLNIADIKRVIEYDILLFRIEVLQENKEEAERILLETLSKATNNDLQDKEAEISIMLGKFYLELKRDYEAAKYLDQGISLLKKVGVIKN